MLNKIDKYKVKAIRHQYVAIVILLLITITSCSKNETPWQESFQTDLNFLAVTQDSVQLGIKIDGEIKATDLMAPTENAKKVSIRFYNKEKKVSIYNVANEQVLFDSTFMINTSTVSLSLYQKASGGPLIFVAPPANDPPPATGYSKISIVYTFSGLPEEVKVVVTNNEATGVDYIPTDSFFLRKGEFSKYFLGRTGIRKPIVYYYTPGADRRLLALSDRSQFSDLLGGFTIYSIRTYRNFSGGVYELLHQKLY